MLKQNKEKKVKSIMPILLLVLTLLFFSFNVNAELMNSTNYKITSAVVSSAGTNTSSTNYQNNLVLGSLAGNINSSNYNVYLGFFQTISNNIPSISSVQITPTSPSSSEDLTCTVTGWSDDDGDSEDYYYEWRNNTVLYTTIHSNISTNILGSGNTTINDVWNCTVTPYDGYENGTSITDQVSVGNSIPSKPVLLEPTNGNNSLFSRYPEFIWNCTDNDADTLNFTLMIEIDAGDSNYTYENFTYSLTGSNYSYTIPDELNTYVETNNHPYLWKVRAYDGTNYSEWSDTYNFSIEETVIINSVNNYIDFGSELELLQWYDTDNSSSPFLFQNMGNVNVTLKNLTTGSFWLSTAAPLGTEYLQYKADNNGTNSTFDESSSITPWTNFSDYNEDVVRNLYYNNGSNYIEVDLKIRVPGDEPPGSRSATMNFHWEIDDNYS